MEQLLCSLLTFSFIRNKITKNETNIFTTNTIDGWQLRILEHISVNFPIN